MPTITPRKSATNTAVIDGNFVKVIQRNLRMPAAVHIRGDLALIPELKGRGVSVLIGLLEKTGGMALFTDLLAKMAETISKFDYDLIYASGLTSARAQYVHTKSVPIVSALLHDPVAIGGAFSRRPRRRADLDLSGHG